MPMAANDEYLGSHWEASGCSWAGRTTKRDGKAVRCGHKHRTAAAAEKCVKKMRKERPGNCQNYRTMQIFLVKRTIKRK